MSKAKAGSSKRKRDVEDDYSGGIEDEMNKSLHGSKKRNTIDSDSEEENGEDYNKMKHSVLRDEDIEGQEEPEDGVEFDGETKITPFNMKDEMEEGYFDGQGTYVWNKKDGSEIKDNWLDSVDWLKLKKETSKEKEERAKLDADSDSSSEDAALLSNKGHTEPLFRECLTYMKPGENILRAIRRHGGGKTLSASERLKQKKLAKRMGEENLSSVKTDDATATSEKSQQDAVNRITEIANKFISLGDMDFYQETFESLSHKIECFNKISGAPQKPESTAAGGFDMFSDD